jgi:hypothetical protein
MATETKNILEKVKCNHCGRIIGIKGFANHLKYKHKDVENDKDNLLKRIVGNDKNKDKINPDYYNGRDVMEIINRYELSFCLGNVVKYVLRSKNKEGKIDLKKALWYLEEEIMQWQIKEDLEEEIKNVPTETN